MPLVAAGRPAADVLALAAVVLVLFAILLHEPWAVALASAALVAGFALWLGAAEPSVYAPLYGAGLLLQTEAAHLALELPARGLVEREVLQRRAVSVALSALLGAALGALVLVLASVKLESGLPLTLAGAAAVATVVVIVRRLAGRA